MACRAVAQAGLAAATASLDDEAAWPLLQVAGWLTTAADLMVEAGLRQTALSLGPEAPPHPSQPSRNCRRPVIPSGGGAAGERGRAGLPARRG